MEMARGSKLALSIRGSEVPLLAQAAELAQQGFVTGASHRNWASYGKEVRLPVDCAEWRRHLLTDPQTSGGLLIACAPERADAIGRSIREAGYPAARVIGEARPGYAGVEVT
jgi:selenide,water dikinase